MLDVKIENDGIRIGRHFRVSFQRTLRIPDDGNSYPLPPGLGTFPVHRVDDFRDRVPASWRERGGVFLPIYQREAMWLNFGGAHWRPNAVKIGIGKINAVSGDEWDEKLKAPKRGKTQNYIVCPDQPWLDGINAGDGFIRQFVAMPLGMGYTVEGQVTGKEQFGGVQIVCFDPKAGKFPDQEPKARSLYRGMVAECAMPAAPMMAGEMGLGAGGKMKQDIYPDEHGIETWDENNFGRVWVHLVDSLSYRDITGKEAPGTPVSPKTYTQAGLLWFDLYDEHKGDVTSSKTLAGVKSIKEMDKQQGFSPQQDDSTIEVGEDQVKKLALKNDPHHVRDGNW